MPPPGWNVGPDALVAGQYLTQASVEQAHQRAASTGPPPPSLRSQPPERPAYEMSAELGQEVAVWLVNVWDALEGSWPPPPSAKEVERHASLDVRPDVVVSAEVVCRPDASAVPAAALDTKTFGTGQPAPMRLYRPSGAAELLSMRLSVAVALSTEERATSHWSLLPGAVLPPDALADRTRSMFIRAYQTGLDLPGFNETQPPWRLERAQNGATLVRNLALLPAMLPFEFMPAWKKTHTLSLVRIYLQQLRDFGVPVHVPRDDETATLPPVLGAQPHQGTAKVRSDGFDGTVETHRPWAELQSDVLVEFHSQLRFDRTLHPDRTRGLGAVLKRAMYRGLFTKRRGRRASPAFLEKVLAPLFWAEAKMTWSESAPKLRAVLSTRNSVRRREIAEAERIGACWRRLNDDNLVPNAERLFRASDAARDINFKSIGSNAMYWLTRAWVVPEHVVIFRRLEQRDRRWCSDAWDVDARWLGRFEFGAEDEVMRIPQEIQDVIDDEDWFFRRLRARLPALPSEQSDRLDRNVDFRRSLARMDRTALWELASILHYPFVPDERWKELFEL